MAIAFGIFGDLIPRSRVTGAGHTFRTGEAKGDDGDGNPYIHVIPLLRECDRVESSFGAR